MIYADALRMSLSINAYSQGKRTGRPARPARIDYSKFKHSSHAGTLKASRKGDLQQLDCAYCHGALTKDNPDVVKGYPSRKHGLKNATTHSACLDCHAMTGRDAITEGTLPAMCLICHQTPSLVEMRKNLRPFPNPNVAESQFFDFYSHADHAEYFKASGTFKERFKDKEKFKEEDNFECAACHAMNRENIVIAKTVAKTQFAPGAKESRPGHPECFICHFNEKEMAKEKPFFAANCEACHAPEKEEAGKGSEPAVHRFVRQIVNSENNPAKPAKPGEEPTVPFSHKSHLIEDDDDKSAKKCLDCQTQKCLECHVTAKKAVKRSDFFLEDNETKEKQPRAAGCIQCHNADQQMQQKIEGPIKLETSKCSYCHSLQTIKDRAASGAQLPPPSHFGKKTAIALPPIRTEFSRGYSADKRRR
ncbi:MAG: multiheme c-type cytochrome [Blastocatellia bacterium]